MDPTRLWYGRHPLSVALLPLAWLYCAVVGLRRLAYRQGLLRRTRLAAAVAVVGNLTVGGTGKTPLTLALAALARERGWRPAILARGYGGRGRDWPQAVAPDSDPGLVGDEPVLLARRSVCPVVAGPDRVAAGELAIRRFGCDLLICDDGLQHYRLVRDLEIVAIDGERGLGNGRCLPAGPLREPAKRLRSADLVVRQGDGGGGYGFRLVAGEAVDVRDPARRLPLAAFRDRRVTAVAGIGNTGRFFALLRAAGMWVDERPYPDHHPYTAAEVAAWPPGPVLMTEKDAVKCATFGGADRWYCPVEAVPDPAFVEAVFARLGPAPGQSPAPI